MSGVANSASSRVLAELSGVTVQLIGHLLYLTFFEFILINNDFRKNKKENKKKNRGKIFFTFCTQSLNN